MKNVFGLIITITLFFTINLWAQVQIIDIKPTTVQSAQYFPQFIDIKLLAPYENPFNTEDIQVDLVITDPEDQYIVLPCFFYAEQGDTSLWQARFTPVAVGSHSYKIRIKTPIKPFISKSFSINVLPSSRNGFVRLNPDSYYSFRFDSGKYFRAIGENVAWANNYEYYFKKLNDNGCNFVRIWMCPWNLYLEWDDPGLGRYHLQNADELDEVINLAEKYDIYIMLCFDYHGVAREVAGYFETENKWLQSPYNAKNGGPCQTASEFFTNPDAQKYYKNRLRYIIARYAYSPHILAWEFWNEVNLTAGKREDVVVWHQEMAAYVKEMDPYHHLVTTSFSGDGFPEIWEIKDFDFSQTHYYNMPDVPQMIIEKIDHYENTYHKPHVIGEFGIEYRGSAETKANDPDHIGFHNGLWSGFFSPTPITPLTWWWDNLIELEDLYFHFNALSQFASDVLQDQSNLQPLTSKPAVTINSNDEDDKTAANLIINPSKSWGKNEVNLFIIEPTGLIHDKNEIPTFLYGRDKADFRNPPTFKINYQKDGRFVVQVNRVSDEGHLKIYLDDDLTFEKKLLLGPPGKGEWESSEWVKEWKIWQGRYNKLYGIEVPAGAHSIRVENDGKDWIEITAYQFINCGIQNRNQVQVLGFQQNQNIFLWLRNRDYSWKQVKDQGPPAPINHATVSIPGVLPGEYLIEWWDTYRGTISKRDLIQVGQNQTIELLLPTLQKDIACKIKKVD